MTSSTVPMGSIDKVVPSKAPGATVAAKTSAVVLDTKVRVRLSGARLGTVAAVGPGETAGSAMVVDLEVTNGSAKPINLEGALVTLIYGKNQVAALGTGAPYAPFVGTLDPGKSTKATYVFRPQGTGAAPQRFTLQFTYSAGSPSVTFSGTAK